MSGLEEVKNSGKERIINHLEAKIDNLEKSLSNQLAESLFSDGTTAKEIGGLRFIVADDPTASSTVGGIAQNTYTGGATRPARTRRRLRRCRAP